MRPLATALPLLASLAAFLTACSGVSAPPKPPLEVIVKVTSDPGRPLPAADVLFGGKPIATTDDTGAAHLVLQGNEGDSYEVSIRCPPGFLSPSKTLSIPLHRLVDDKAPEYEIACPPTKRNVVVAVRAENGGNLPVLFLGRAIGRTDPTGATTVLLKDLDADAAFSLTLDTTEKGAEWLRPQSPVNAFTVKHADDVLVWDLRFTNDAPKKVHHYIAKPKGPQVLKSGL